MPNISLESLLFYFNNKILFASIWSRLLFMKYFSYPSEFNNHTYSEVFILIVLTLSVDVWTYYDICCLASILLFFPHWLASCFLLLLFYPLLLIVYELLCVNGYIFTMATSNVLERRTGCTFKEGVQELDFWTCLFLIFPGCWPLCRNLNCLWAPDISWHLPPQGKPNWSWFAITSSREN
jgi:hypothetical protein